MQALGSAVAARSLFLGYLSLVAWWYMERYLNFPHALGMIYEYKEEIEKFCETSNLMDVFIFLQKKMIFLYRLAKANGYIE